MLPSAAWALQAWLRPPWARLGALLLAANVVVGTLWSLGYRGTFVPAAAGAQLLDECDLVLGEKSSVRGDFELCSEPFDHIGAVTRKDRRSQARASQHGHGLRRIGTKPVLEEQEARPMITDRQ